MDQIPALDLFSLKGDTVLITGATRGIGAACAIALAQAGASLVIVVRPRLAKGSIDEAGVEEAKAVKVEDAKEKPNEGKENEAKENKDPAIIAEILTASPRTKREQLYVIECDLGNMEDVKSLFPRALQLLPSQEAQINILVNCAGIQRRNKAVDFEEADWDDVSIDFFYFCDFRFLDRFSFFFSP
ncbi:hypothetical protein CPB83DRAFT_187384 [Crepidotus variabilis]|uniref:Uncharacterized protein n=1 Tax=Crepidotus variabilis TaxID=179855 RepID=A0A9P6JQY3_9AGAR|nr:hypothetical protein CPB83DRAFT_187384 [Crepidotus variabilis]